MAIVADLIGAKGTVRLGTDRQADAIELPPVSVARIAAAGFVDLTADAELFYFHNLATSQTVYIRVNLDSDNTAAASGDNQSLRVDPGETLPFGLPYNADATNYKLSVA
jgi:hypothetical protein